LALLIGAPAVGHAAEAAAAEAASSKDTIAEVVVTAERRETNIQSTPLAVTALGAEQLQRAGVQSVGDLARVVPTVQFVQTGLLPQIYIRGIGLQQSTGTTDPGVATHIDGVYLGRPIGTAAAMYDLERVEVLRGPQGTLYGRNATGGSINFITKGPSKSFTADGVATVGNYRQFRFEGGVGGPITDSVSGRLAVLYDRRDSYIENLTTGNPLSRPETFAGRLKLRYAPGDSGLQVDFSADYMKTTGDAPEFSVRNLYPQGPAYVSPPLGQLSPKAHAIYTDIAKPLGTVELAGANLTVAYDFGAATLKSITAARSSVVHRSWDGDGTTLANEDMLNGHEKSLQYSQEFQLLSNGAGPFSWVMGAYYFRETPSDDYQWAIKFNVSPFGAPPFVVPFDLRSRDHQKTRAWALFGQASYEFTSKLKATVGLRYSDDHKRISEYQYAQLVGLAPAAVTTYDDSASWSALTPKFGLEYKLPNGMAYVSATRGFKAGGFNASNPGQTFPFDPEYIWNYEAGFKADWFDHRLRTNLAVFHAEYSDLQVVQFVNTASVIKNAATARIDGLELEAIARPLAGLELTGALSLLDTAYKKSNPSFQLFDPVFKVPVDMTGRRLPFSPKAALNLGLQYTRTVPALRGDLQFNANYHWQDDSALDSLLQETETQKAYGLFDARLGYSPENSPFEVAVFVRNLTNKSYWVTLLRGNEPIGGNIGTEGAPRTYGVQVRFRY
jgi:iron complex outermembrane receptor protein